VSERFTRRALLIGSAAAFAGGAAGGCRAKRPPALIGVRLGRQAGVGAIAFLRDGTRALAADRTAEGTINVWDLRARKITRSIRVGQPVRFLALDEARGLLAVASPQSPGRYAVGLLDLATGRRGVQIDGGRAVLGLDRMLVAREGLLTTYADRGLRESSTLWSFETGREIAGFGRPAEAIAADRRTVLGGRVIWDLESGRIRGELKNRWRVWGEAISPDGRRAVSERGGGGILWDASGEVVRDLADQGNAVARAAFSPDDRFLLTGRYPESFRGDRRLLVLRDAHTGRLLADLPGHDMVVTGIAFSPDGAAAISGGLNGELILWRMPERA